MYQLVTFVALSGVGIGLIGAAQYSKLRGRGRRRRLEIADQTERNYAAAVAELRASQVRHDRTGRTITVQAPPPDRTGRTWSSMSTRFRDRTARVALYSKCRRCGRRLTDPDSQRSGYGPECRT